MQEYSQALRKFRETVEPIAASVYFAPEPLGSLTSLGLSPIEAYFCGRSAPMGRVDGSVISSIFAFFKPSVAISATNQGWDKADPNEVVRARLDGISKYFTRVIGPEPDETTRLAVDTLLSAVESVSDMSRPLFAAWRNIELPRDDVNLALWRACDLFREHRGAAHAAAWLTAGLHPRECVVLSKHWWGMESNSYLAVHGWSKDDVSESEKELETLGYLEDGRITPKGIELRDEVEDLTDRMQCDIVAALAGKLEELTTVFSPTRDLFVETGGYPLARVPTRA
jgi:hypothetical protein